MASILSTACQVCPNSPVSSNSVPVALQRKPDDAPRDTLLILARGRQLFASLLLLCVLTTGRAFGRDAKFVVRQSDASPHRGFVTVQLGGRANALMDVGLPGTHLTVDGIPSDLTEKPGNNLFLKDAGWRNWEKDPSSYYSPHDGRADDDPRRFILNVPVDDYAAVYLLAAAEKGEEFSPAVSFRIGVIEGSRQTTHPDFSAETPWIGDTRRTVVTVPGAKGNLFLVRVPLGNTVSQDFKGRRALDVDEPRNCVPLSVGRTRVVTRSGRRASSRSSASVSPLTRRSAPDGTPLPTRIPGTGVCWRAMKPGWSGASRTPSHS